MNIRRALRVALAGLPLAVAPLAAQPLPDGTTPCDMSGYSVDTDPAGANLRAAPSRDARILGKLAAPVKSNPKLDMADPGDGVWRTEFKIIGYRDGFFLIEKARHPLLDEDYNRLMKIPKARLRSHAGRGWIAAGLVGGQYANGNAHGMGALFSEPRADAPATPAHNRHGAPISTDGGPKRVLECRSDWVKVESHDGVTGWWNSLCSTQVTNCS